MPVGSNLLMPSEGFSMGQMVTRFESTVVTRVKVYHEH